MLTIGKGHHSHMKFTDTDQDVDQDLIDVHRHGGRWLAKAPNLHNEMEWDEAHRLKGQFHDEANRKKEWNEEAFKLHKQ